MAERAPGNLALELQGEKRLLQKAEADIDAGWRRLCDQQELLNSLRITGQSTTEAERLVELLRRTLLEWERHRRLIEQRIDYLEAKKSFPGQG